MNEMTLKDAFRIILNKIWLVVAIPFVAVVVATILVTFVIEPQYTASTTMYVLNKQNADNNVINYADLQSSQLLTADYRELALSARVLSAVADQLGLNAEDLQKKYDITVTAANNTRVIQISATSEDAVLAANLANTIGQEFAVSVMEIMDVNNVSVVDVAVPPTEPSAPRKLMAIAGAGVGGLAVAVALVLVMEMFNTTIRTREDVERALGLTVLASIPKVEVKA